jgi:hypothetical protein
MDALTPLFAHAGHWVVYVLYALPVLIVVGSIVRSIARRQHLEDPR